MEAAFNKKNNGSIPKECTDVCGKMNNTCCSFSNQEVADCTLGGADTCDLGGEPHDGTWRLRMINMVLSTRTKIIPM